MEEIDLTKFEKEAEEIQAFLSRPDAYADPDFAAKSRRINEVNDILALGKEISQLKKNLAEAEELLSKFVLVPAATRLPCLQANFIVCTCAMPKNMV